MGMIVDGKEGRFNDYGRGSKGVNDCEGNKGNDCAKGNGRMVV